jgi:hypothetical protein
MGGMLTAPQFVRCRDLIPGLHLAFHETFATPLILKAWLQEGWPLQFGFLDATADAPWPGDEGWRFALLAPDQPFTRDYARALLSSHGDEYRQSIDWRVK